MITENELYEALEVAAQTEDLNATNNPELDKAMETIILYIMQDGGEFTDQEIADQISLMIAQHIINGLAHKGLIGVDFDEDGNEIYVANMDFNKE